MTLPPHIQTPPTGLDKVLLICQKITPPSFEPTDLLAALSDPAWDQKVFSPPHNYFYSDHIHTLYAYPSLPQWADEIGQDTSQPFIVRRNAIEILLVNIKFSTMWTRPTIFDPTKIPKNTEQPGYVRGLMHTLYMPFLQAIEQRERERQHYCTPWEDVLNRQEIPNAVKANTYAHKLVCTGLEVSVSFKITESSAETIVAVLTQCDRLLKETRSEAFKENGPKVLSEILQQSANKTGFAPAIIYSDYRFLNYSPQQGACWRYHCWWIWIAGPELVCGYETSGWLSPHTPGQIIKPFAWISLDYLPSHINQISELLYYVLNIPARQQELLRPPLPPEASPRCRVCRATCSFDSSFSLYSWSCQSCQARNGEIIH